MRSLSLAVLLTFATPLAAAPTAESVVRQFDAVVLGRSGLDEDKTDRVLKWTGPVRVLVAGLPAGADAPHRAEVRSVLSELAALTGLDIALVDAPARANARVVFAARSDFGRLLARGVGETPFTRAVSRAACLAGVYERAGVVTAGFALIGIDNPQRLIAHCLPEELAQMLGPANDACHYRPSVFCEDDLGPGLSDGDRLLLRALYDPRVRPGMRRAEALPVVRSLVTGWLAGAR